MGWKRLFGQSPSAEEPGAASADVDTSEAADPLTVQSSPEQPLEYTAWAAEVVAAIQRGDESVMRWALSQYVLCRQCSVAVFALDAWPNRPRQAGEQLTITCPKCHALWMGY